ncbi:helix-hairpin-helix domain-containing protein [Halobacillus karajensis]|nr:helix-hairpin-helix domain-containing protein [Halobacillus karajensis]
MIKRYGWIFIVLLVIGLLYLLKFNDGPETQEVELKSTEFEDEIIEEPNLTVSVIKVDVKGEVKKRGVYSMPDDTRVDDVIKRAGGMTEDADPTSVNLAQRLQDEMVIFVASKQKGEGGSSEIISSSEEKISINRASSTEIEALNGIGPSKAASIIEYREENGPFSSVEDLVNVPGIGEKTLEIFKDQIMVP